MTTRSEKIRLLFKGKPIKDALAWSEFNSDQSKYSGSVVFVHQNDFLNGTIRIRERCRILLGEDISFNPNRGFGCKIEKELLVEDPTLVKGHNWFPTNQQLHETHDKDAYRLGFFAAITIETTAGVWIDLNKHTLKQSDEHKLMQRFFSLIELSDQPFLPKQGPAEFGPTIDAGANILISNGTIGQSSHHGIHGNNNENVFFEDLVVSDYEVAGIALNGARNVFYNNVRLTGTHRNIPVLGTFSGLRFMDKFVEATIPHVKTNQRLMLQEKLTLSRLVQQQVYYSKIMRKRGTLNAIPETTYKQIVIEFFNPTGLIDGNSYGILHNGSGVAVNGFTEDLVQYNSHNIELKNVRIESTIGKIKEVITLAKVVDGKLKVLVDTAGNVLHLRDITNKDGTYKYTILSDYKITLANVVRSLKPDAQRRYGTLFIPAEICKWRESEKPITDFITYGRRDGQYTIVRNGDTMNHQQKGVLGIRMDGVEKIRLNDVVITKVVNKGSKGRTDVYYTNGTDGGHPLQSGNSPNIGYMGSDVFGIGLFACKDFTIKDVILSDIVSNCGKCIGIEIEGRTTGVNVIDEVTIEKLAGRASIGLEKGPSKNTNSPVVCGIHTGKYVEGLSINNIDVEEMEGVFGWCPVTKFSLNGSVTLGCKAGETSSNNFGYLIIVPLIIVIILIVLFSIKHR